LHTLGKLEVILIFRMEDILYSNELFEPIELNGIKLDAKTDDEWKKLNRKAVGHIRQ
jgi:hypothetical protein